MIVGPTKDSPASINGLAQVGGSSARLIHPSAAIFAARRSLRGTSARPLAPPGDGRRSSFSGPKYRKEHSKATRPAPERQWSQLRGKVGPHGDEIQGHKRNRETAR